MATVVGNVANCGCGFGIPVAEISAIIFDITDGQVEEKTHELTPGLWYETGERTSLLFLYVWGRKILVFQGFCH